jgi:hypothetical protein
MLRGDTPPEKVKHFINTRAAGHVIDKNGKIQFHIVASWWANGIILGFALLLFMCAILMIFIFQNRLQIQTLEQQVDRVEQKTN